ncbi:MULTISPECIES: methyl-accepting chemotaxis protein [Sphingomonas]|uniref:methyl-accepting chemotaxis protein n=1 Tax=Sphingomonas TaxID=13687 RepID=UPI00082A343E|nr:methyl-accepting chemotaxis protein [Sphingomonas sp. CCH10-B3]
MDQSERIEAVIVDVARQCGALVMECADVGGHVAVASDQIDRTIADLDEFDSVADALARDHASVATAIGEARALTARAKTQLTQGTAAIVEAIGGFGDVSERIVQLSTRVARMAEALEQVQQVSQLIGGIAQQTNMLALNAAIEAARAGGQGSAFAVVANEVKRLAQHTRDATQRIDRTVGALAEEANAFTREVTDGAAQGRAAVDRFGVIRSTVADLGTIVARVDEQTDGIAASSAQMQRSIAAAQNGLALSARATRENGRALRKARGRLEGLESACNLMLDQLAHSGVTIDDTPLIERAKVIAREITDVVERAIRRGEIGMADVFDTDYRPIPGTDPVQHNVRFCDFADRYIRPILDRVTREIDKSIGSVISNVDGYLPTHLTLRSQPQGPDREWNNTWSRNRRHMGLDDATGRAVASEAPAMLSCYCMALGHEEFLPLKTVFVPLRFNGRRWGNYELAYVDTLSPRAESISQEALEASLAMMRGQTSLAA